MPTHLFSSEIEKVKSDRAFVYHEGFSDWTGAVLAGEETIEGKRHYLIDGRRFPSITTILAADPTKQKILARWRARVGKDEAKKVSQAATVRGKGLHKMCEEYVTTSATEVKNHMDRENFNKIRGTLDRKIGSLFCLEKPLYSIDLGIAGRTDLIADWKHEDGVVCPTVIDFKTSGKTKYRKNISQYFIQGAAYALMFEHMTGIAVPRIAIAIVTEELPEPQLFEERTDEWVPSLKSAIAVYWEAQNSVKNNIHKENNC